MIFLSLRCSFRESLAVEVLTGLYIYFDFDDLFCFM